MALKRYVGVAIILLGLTCAAIVLEASDSSTVNFGANQSITAHSTCRNVTNNSATGQSVYVPTVSSAEWASFRNNPPAGVSIAACQFPETCTKDFDYRRERATIANWTGPQNVSFWIKPLAYPTSESYIILMRYRGVYNANDYNYLGGFAMYPDGTLSMIITGRQNGVNRRGWVRSSGSIPLNEWTHVFMRNQGGTIPGNTDNVFWFNGVEQDMTRYGNVIAPSLSMGWMFRNNVSILLYNHTRQVEFAHVYFIGSAQYNWNDFVTNTDGTIQPKSFAGTPSGADLYLRCSTPTDGTGTTGWRALWTNEMFNPQ